MVCVLERVLQYNRVNLDLERINDEIRQVFDQFNKVKNPETALVAEKIKKKFKGEYRICGETAHKAGDSWDSEANRSKRPK
jgi:hypothetical protein